MESSFENIDIDDEHREFEDLELNDRPPQSKLKLIPEYYEPIQPWNPYQQSPCTVIEAVNRVEQAAGAPIETDNLELQHALKRGGARCSLCNWIAWPFRVLGYGVIRLCESLVDLLPDSRPSSLQTDQYTTEAAASARPPVIDDDRDINAHSLGQAVDQTDIGSAMLGYHISQVRHGRFDGKAVSLLVFDFSLDYDDRATITRAEIGIIFSSAMTQQPTKPKGDIVPFATDLCWPRNARGPCQPTEIAHQTCWKVSFGIDGFNISTPEILNDEKGTRTDSGWWITGSPVFVFTPGSFPWRRSHRFRIVGHEYNRFPVPTAFSLGVVVQNDGQPFSVHVDVKGSLRGWATDGMAKLTRRWRAERPRRWKIEPNASDEVINMEVLRMEMEGRWRELVGAQTAEDKEVPTA